MRRIGQTSVGVRAFTPTDLSPPPTCQHYDRHHGVFRKPRFPFGEPRGYVRVCLADGQTSRPGGSEFRLDDSQDPSPFGRGPVSLGALRRQERRALPSSPVKILFDIVYYRQTKTASIVQRSEFSRNSGKQDICVEILPMGG